MAFKLNSVVPWGRTLDEYRRMFLLTDDDMSKRIIGFGDGPASFNCEATKLGFSVTSVDPIYQFSAEQLRRRIDEVCVTVIQQMRENMENYVWTQIRSLEELENLRMTAMNLFLKDYQQGKAETRYICHELPEELPFDDNTFDIGLSSHFLLMYTALGYDFHIGAISEMLRVCREVRIFPVVDLDGKRTSLTDDIIAYFKQLGYGVETKCTDYEFQKCDNEMLVIKDRNKELRAGL